MLNRVAKLGNVWYHITGNYRDRTGPVHRAANVLHLRGHDDGVPVRGGLSRAHRSTGGRQSAVRVVGVRGRVPGRGRPGPPTAGAARPAVQRGVRRARIPYHREPAPKADIRHERHRVRFLRQRHGETGGRRDRVRPKRDSLDGIMVPVVVDLLPDGLSHRTGEQPRHPPPLIGRTRRPV